MDELCHFVLRVQDAEGLRAVSLSQVVKSGDVEGLKSLFLHADSA